MWCVTPDCNYAFEWNIEEDGVEFECEKCKKSYCLACRVPFHKGMTCKEYKINTKEDENDVKFKELVVGQQFKQCSSCKFWVERNEGCDHMTCRCGFEFCYKCGTEYDHDNDEGACPCEIAQNKAWQ